MKGRNRSSWSNKQHSFSRVPTVSKPRSTFSRPARTTSTIDAGYIYPMHVDEVLPGDTFRFRAHFFGRLATPFKAFMHNLFLDHFMFFIPNRIVWENWERFQGAQDDPDSSVDFQIPQMVITGGAAGGTLADYMGIPTQALGLSVNALPFRSYNRCYDEFFRDQNLQDSLQRDISDSASLESNHILKRRGKRKDYLTGALPWVAKGTEVLLPLGTRADVKGIGKFNQTYTTGPTSRYVTGESGTVSFADYQDIENITDKAMTIEEDPNNSGFPNIYADLTSATSTTLAALRSSIAMQQILELDARTGTRINEQIKARFGVDTQDFRLQRPEYLGGGSQPISIVPVPLTSEASTGVGGQVTAYGISAGSGGFTHSFVEHGTLLVLVSIRADLMYYQGLQRFWSRLDRLDYYEPALSHLSEQPIYNREIFADNSANDALVWGYAERFSEYKYGYSMCTGLMRPNAVGTLSQWNLAEEFPVLPTLSDGFIQEDPPIDRVIVVDTEPHFLIDCWFDNQCTRVMSVYNTPGLERL